MVKTGRVQQSMEMPEEENLPNQERRFPSSLENAKSAFPTFPPLRRLLLSLFTQKSKTRKVPARGKAELRNKRPPDKAEQKIAALKRCD